MQGAVLYGPRDVRFEERAAPRIIAPTDAVIKMSATCVCGSDLWPYRGINPTTESTHFRHEYCGIVEEVGTTTINDGNLTVSIRSPFDALRAAVESGDWLGGRDNYLTAILLIRAWIRQYP